MKVFLSVMKSHCFLVMTVSFFMNSSISLAGGIDTGGGSLVTTVSGETGLIDYFTHAPGIFAKPSQLESLSVPKTKALSEQGIDKIDLKSLGAWRPLLYRIERWKISSPILVEYLVSALNNISLYFVNNNLDITDQRYFIPDRLKDTVVSINTVAFYIKSIGLVISKPEFEEMKYEDQIGLLMKEILRHIQITYETNLSAEQLQHLNASLALGPEKQETLDSVLHNSEKMLTKISDLKSIEDLEKKLFDNICEYGKTYNLNWCDKNESVIDLINKLSSRRELIENEEEAFKIRLLIIDAFKVLDKRTVFNLADSIPLPVYDAIQQMSLENILLKISTEMANTSNWR